jgi:hypothetical protein
MKIMNKKHINESLIQQFRYETDTWKRLLEFIQAENVFLKTRLAQIIKEGIDQEMLEEFEYFQNYFIAEDHAINRLRQNVAKQENILNREIFEDGTVIRETLMQRKELRKEVEQSEGRFNKLKFEFNAFLSE